MTRLFSRTILRLSPLEEREDVRSFLQGLVTQDLTGSLPAWSALLSPQGKVLFDFFVWSDYNDLLIDCQADVAEALTKRLSLYRLRRKISIVPDESLSVHWLNQPGNDPRLPSLGTRWLDNASPDDADSDEAYRAHRLSLGVTEGRSELGDGELLWLECNAVELNGVSFSKGCYIGQENTARMNWRQKVNRRLLVMPMELSNPARQRIAYPELCLAVDHLRIEDITPAMLPEWLKLEV